MSRRRPLALAALLAVGLLAVTACGADEQTQTELAQERAQEGLKQSYSATYALDTFDKDEARSPAGTMTVWRTPESLRLDIATDSGTSSSITTATGTVACQKPANGKAPTCLTVAGPGQTPPATFDLALKKAFGDSLRVLATPPAGLDVGGDGDDTMSAAGQDCRYFVVTESTDAKLPDGSYCLSSDGIPVKLEFTAGQALLTKLDRASPAATSFQPLVSPTALPPAG